MKTQISRDPFDSGKRYSGVYLQQGRMITDADLNEGTEIARHRLDDALADTVTSGVPRENGLKLEAVAGQPLRLYRGRLYADGVGALVTGPSAGPTQPFGLGEQEDLPLPGDATPPKTSFRLYADVWERPVTSLEDPGQLSDPALHGADTATRTQTVAQLKWCHPDIDPEDPAVNPPAGNAGLTLTMRNQPPGSDPCDPCAREITVPARVGNYLFRLEVHAVEGTAASPAALVLKWSSENGAEQHAVGSEPADFKASDWVYEFFTTRTEKHLGVHLPGGITPLAGLLAEGFPAPAPVGFPFVRRWDGYCRLQRQGGQWVLQDGRERGVDLATGTAAEADGHVSFTGEHLGIQLSALALDLSLAGGTCFVAGDYWLATVREAVHQPGNPETVLDGAPPAGIHHHYLLLATTDDSGKLLPAATGQQQRLDFPSLTTLAARDVDYQADCPSGLFDASHDTVQKALDRVCGITAEHVGFSKPCDASVFKGVDRTGVKTVAQALALLCDLRADQIAYRSDPACTTLTGATTVQQALDLLCRHETISGCRTTVGVGGEFATLKQAVDAFLARGETVLAFSLLPGEHLVDQAIQLTPVARKQLHFSLAGCGPGSVLRLSAGLSVAGCTTVRLADLAVTIEANATFEASGGEEVAIEGCQFLITDHDATPPITLSAGRLLRLTGNDVQSLRTISVRKGREVLTAEPVLTGIFAERLSAQEAGGEITRAAAELAAAPLARRRALAAAIEKEITDRAAETAPAENRLTLAQAEAFRNVASVLTSRSRSLAGDLARELAGLRVVLLGSVPALAVVVSPEGGHADISGNRIIGILSVYGRPGDIALTLIQRRQLGLRLADRTVTLQSHEESLLLTRNQISQLRIGGDLMIKLRDLSDPAGGPGTVECLYRTARLTDNLFTLGGNDLVCAEATLAGNRFADGNPHSMVVASTAFYLGNHAASPAAEIASLAPRINAQTRSELNSVSIRTPTEMG